jgi:hypothetical protein
LIKKKRRKEREEAKKNKKNRLDFNGKKIGI